MYPNGVTHEVVANDQEGMQSVIDWLNYTPKVPTIAHTCTHVPRSSIMTHTHKYTLVPSLSTYSTTVTLPPPDRALTARARSRASTRTRARAR